MRRTLIIGLGNIGPRYDCTRHNVGFDTLDLFKSDCVLAPEKEKLNALVQEGTCGAQRVILAKPTTYMNESGLAVRHLMDWYGLTPQDCIILSDDIDLPAGQIRLRPHGGAGTHNGWRSILQRTGSDHFPRIRIGVGAPPPQWDLADWVLSKYRGAADEQAVLAGLALAKDALRTILTGGLDTAMNQFNRKPQAHV